ncbi:MAG: CoA-transferase [Bacillota bacterium]|nr:CoA-transferase [Bacillota bacterium]
MRGFISVEEAARLVKDGDTISSEGFLNSMFPEDLFTALENRFLTTGSPRNLTVYMGGGKGDYWGGKGLNHLAHEGLIGRVVGSHWGVCRKLEQMIAEHKVAAYNLPQGVMGLLFRAQAAGQPGVITPVGLETYIDPRVEDGSKVNLLSTEELVRVMTIDGQDYLYYKTQPVNVAFLRGTTADEHGNISIEKEALNLDTFPIALAAKNSGGLVVFQVERIAAAGSLHPRSVKVPGAIVDYVVVGRPEYHQQTLTYSYNPAYTGEIRVPLAEEDTVNAAPALDERRVIQRRAAMELEGREGLLNLGIGISDGVLTAARELGISHKLISTIESGVIGGRPARDLDFGAAINPEAIIDMVDMFAIYNGGGLNTAVLGMGQADRAGNVNVTKFSARSPGAGGFIDISQGAKKVIFTGTFTASELEVEVGGGRLRIIKEGKIRKLVDQVEQISFSGHYASKYGKEVVYVTERAVFRLLDGQMVLTEIAPGVDLERDVLGQMGFVPVVSPDLRFMDEKLFR